MTKARVAAVSGMLLAAIYGAADGRAATGPPRKPATYEVTIEEMQFRPAQLSVHSGDWIVFANKDLFPHTVTADGKSFDSLSIAPSSSWKYRAAQPGVYSYHCAFHPTMKGKMAVR